MDKKYDRRNFIRRTTGGSPGDNAFMGANLFSENTATRHSGDKPVRLGFVGIGGRGAYHLNAALGIEGVEVPAICELKPTRLYQAKRWVENAGLPTPTLYDQGPEDYKRLCEQENLDAVICCTPWEFHTPVCLAAMRNNKHAVSEVPIVVTLDEAWELVETYEKTGKWATIGLEGLGNLSVLNMIRKGMFGKIVHAEGGYVHDLRLVKFDPDEEPWRLQHSIERNGNLYPDHPMASIMPYLDINHGDRFDYLVSMSSSSVMLKNYAELNYGKDSAVANAVKNVALGDCNVTLMRTVQGKMITLNHDTSTPHPREFSRLQGTKGVYIADQGSRRIYLEGVSPKVDQWEPADKYLEENRPSIIANYNPPPRRGGGKIEGHGGGGSQTPMVWTRLIAALRENKMPDWDVYDSVTSSAISPVTEQSVANKCRPVDFPDFTKGKWQTSKPRLTLS
ncbi:MAG: Gfo/Idh/MocA family oxidoreductase [Chitinophagaceae bacterium]|nr:Gfo/Idh/MocA family oxidoreductase [Chitinophagaceae bacterium]